MTASKRRNNNPAQLSHALVLNKYILSLFGVEALEELASNLKDPSLEGYDAENVSHFYRIISAQAVNKGTFTADMLLEYDENILRHTTAISEKRAEPIKWKYFQYLALLFTEVYLDRYFSNKSQLLEELNSYLEHVFLHNPNNYNKISPFKPDDLNKLAFWNATGSGKTLLMHVNIKQFLHYSKGEVHNRIILLTPNEGLSSQHLREFDLSNINAAIFNKSAKCGGMFQGNDVEIIEISKIADDSKDKTVAVNSFETNNLVLVDEGHKGTGGDVWKLMRGKMSETGFSFEYSATFSQSIHAAASGKKEKLLEEYGKATIFDYSYKYFYKDGYGKDYQILNLNQKWDNDRVELYLTACMIGFYEQMCLFEDNRRAIKPFLIDKPLAIFVGGSVTATTSQKDVSDIVSILKFIQDFVGEKPRTVANIERILSGTDGLVDENDHSIFANSFKYLRKIGLTAEAMFDRMLKTVFNSPISGARLHVDNIKGQSGELGLRVGDCEYFGVVNVGDDAKLLKQCDEAGILTGSQGYSNQSLFGSINTPDSEINVLIGSRKFSEGWSSWRVSTMGLMNIGQSEGSQIIQMFGRGVRLKGYNFTLKRSSELTKIEQEPPAYLSLLETLNIFGIRADYMDQFRDYLAAEGLPTNSSNFSKIYLPVKEMPALLSKKLKVISIEPERDFKKEVTVDLALSDKIKVTLDYYPKVQILKSRQGDILQGIPSQLKEGKFTNSHLAFIDWDQVFFDMQQFKNERGWYNLNILKEDVKNISKYQFWYTLFIPPSELEFTDFKKTILWQEILVSLLKLYTYQLYNSKKSEWESEHVIPVTVDSNDSNLITQYKVSIHPELKTLSSQINELKAIIEKNEFTNSFTAKEGGVEVTGLYFSQHLYQPLIFVNPERPVSNDTGAEVVTVSPIGLNKGEVDFVEDLKSFYIDNPGYFSDKELYLLRNRSRKGIGFFKDTHNFYPDFILWILTDNIQHISFIDPKGLRQVAGINSDKIALHKRIKTDIEPRIRKKDEALRLDSFIISTTKYSEPSWVNDYDISEFNSRNVYFMEEQEDYIQLVLDKILESK